MSENEYVATAAAQKRLREVLTAAYEGLDVHVETLADVLLENAKIEYKARAKQVVISLDLPDTATTAQPSKVLRKDGSDPIVTAPDGTPIASEPAVPQPHIGSFVPTADYEPTEDDVHYD